LLGGALGFLLSPAAKAVTAKTNSAASSTTET